MRRRFYISPALGFKFLVLTIATLGGVAPQVKAGEAQRVEANCVVEVTLGSEKSYANPFLEISVEAEVTPPDGKRLTIPAFWAGGNRWSFRYASGQAGRHAWRSVCSDKTNAKLDGIEGSFDVVPYTGNNPLYRHGPLRIGDDQRHFAHADGTPFLWLGDTWWKNLCQRLSWEGFQELAADRKSKGFNVVQIVCGVYPDEGLFEPRWGNEGGMPYLAKDFSVVNPKYFEYADRRFEHLIDSGIVPAIVAGWGRPDCNGMLVGVEGIKRHCRYLVARYGAFPVVWIIGGEIPEETRKEWKEVGVYLRSVDPYGRPTTAHCLDLNGPPGETPVMNFEMTGGSHDAVVAITPAVLKNLTSLYDKTPPRPVLVGETCYEQHMQQGFQDVQRHMFWMYMLSGAAGHTYGAAGVWHASVNGDPGIANVYDWTTWKEGMNYAGSAQVGLGKKLLEQYPWHRFRPHPEWAEPGCYAAGIPGEVRIVYLPRRNIYNWTGPTVKGLEPDIDWRVYYFDPATGRTFDRGTIKAQEKVDGKTLEPVEFKQNVPSPQDWILVFERIK